MARRLFIHGNSASGLSLIETIIASAILVGTVAYAGVKMKNARQVINRMKALSVADSVVNSVRSIAVNHANILYSAKKSTDNDLLDCVVEEDSCTDNQDFELPIYIPGSNNPITGSSASYDEYGKLCSDSSCYLQVNTRLITYCSYGGSENKSCKRPRYLLLTYDVKNAKTNKVLHRDSVEVIPDKRKWKNLSLYCPNNFIIRGIGINGDTICANVNNITYKDQGQLGGGGAYMVQPKDCRNTKTEQQTVKEKQKQMQPQTDPATGQPVLDPATGQPVMVEVEVEVDVVKDVQVPINDDSNYFAGFDDQRKVICLQKDW